MKVSSHVVARLLGNAPAAFYRYARLGRLHVFWATKKPVDSQRPSRADLPVATGVTTEDETALCCGSGMCAAPKHIHGCYADIDGSACDDPDDHPAPAPVVSAGDEAARETERVRAAVADLHREVHEALPIEQSIEKCRLCTPAADLPVATGAEVDSLDAPPVVIEEVLRLAEKERATGVTTEDEEPEPCAVQFCSALRTQGKFCDRHAYKNPVSCEHGELLADPCTECHFDANADDAPAPVVSAGDEGLSEEEREVLEVVFLDYRRGRFVLPNPIFAAVERILADREARRG